MKRNRPSRKRRQYNNRQESYVLKYEQEVAAKLEAERLQKEAEERAERERTDKFNRTIAQVFQDICLQDCETDSFTIGIKDANIPAKLELKFSTPHGFGTIIGEVYLDAHISSTHTINTRVKVYTLENDARYKMLFARTQWHHETDIVVVRIRGMGNPELESGFIEIAPDGKIKFDYHNYWGSALCRTVPEYVAILHRQYERYMESLEGIS